MELEVVRMVNRDAQDVLQIYEEGISGRQATLKPACRPGNGGMQNIWLSVVLLQNQKELFSAGQP